MVKKLIKSIIVKILKKSLSWLIYYSGINHLLYKIGDRKTFILVYHRVLDLNSNFSFDSSLVSSSVDNFKRQMQYLSEKYNVISLEKFIEYHKKKISPPKNSVVITFDDGYRDNYEHVYPILKKYRLPAAVFIATDAVEKNELFWWDRVAYIVNKTKIDYFEIKELGKYSLGNKCEKLKAIKAISLRLKNMDETKKNYLIEKLICTLKVKIPDMEKNKRLLLSWNEIREMSKDGILFGSHTASHPILTNISIADAGKEIKKSKSLLEKNISKKINFFSYPNGYYSDFNDEIKKIIKNNGFKCALTYIPGWNGIESDLLELRRNPVSYDTDIIMFRNKMVGFDIFPVRLYLFFNKLFRRKRP